MSSRQYTGAEDGGYPGAAAKEDVFDVLRRCQQRFHCACDAYQKAGMERSVAEKDLQAASKEATQAITNALMDPTQERSLGATQGNGRY